MGSHRVGHDWSDLAAAAAAEVFWEVRALAKCENLEQEALFRSKAGAEEAEVGMGRGVLKHAEMERELGAWSCKALFSILIIF